MSDFIDHAREEIHHAHHQGSPSARLIAVLIAILAAMLALAEIGEKGSQNAYITHHVTVTDDWAFFQAKNVRATMFAAEADILASINPPDPGAQAKIVQAQKNEARMRDEPNGDGMKQLGERAKAEEAARDLAFHRYHEFEIVVGALQIAIVLASVAVVTSITALAIGAAAIGLLAGIFGVVIAAGL